MRSTPSDASLHPVRFGRMTTRVEAEVDPTSWKRWGEIQKVFSGLREDVVVDCGHVPIRCSNQRYTFGGADGVSETMLSSFFSGLAMTRRLRAEGRRVKLNVCLSDTSRLLDDKNRRGELATIITQGKYSECLPSEYLEGLSSADFDDLVVMLQTRNSNRFARVIKKIKVRAKASNSDAELYDDLGVVLLRSNDGEQFAVSGPFLIAEPEGWEETERSRWACGGSDKIEANDEDRKALQFIRENARIALYQKSIGPLCPATYGGLLLHYDERYDHICVYSRNDDAHITEKLLRGVISANWLKADFSRTCVQIVFPELSNVPELSVLESHRLRQYRLPFSQMVAYLKSRRVFDALSFYRLRSDDGHEEVLLR